MENESQAHAQEDADQYEVGKIPEVPDVRGKVANEAEFKKEG